MGKIRRHRKGLIAGLLLVVAVLAVGVPYAYIHWVEGDQPPPLSVDSAAPSAGVAEPVADLEGGWVVGSGSQAGYRVPETLAGQSVTAVGRTDDVTGSVLLTGSTVSTGSISVDVASISSDRSQRDSAFSGRIMQSSQFPKATFTLTKAIDLGTVPAVGATVTATATGDLTLHGVTRPVSFPVSVKRSAASVAVAGTVPITYADYQIDNPSIGGFVSVGDGGSVEFLLVLTKK